MSKFIAQFYVITPKGRCEIDAMLDDKQTDRLSYKFSGMEPEEAEIQLDQDGQPYVIIEENVYYLNRFKSVSL